MRHVFQHVPVHFIVYQAHPDAGRKLLIVFELSDVYLSRTGTAAVQRKDFIRKRIEIRPVPIPVVKRLQIDRRGDILPFPHNRQTVENYAVVLSHTVYLYTGTSPFPTADLFHDFSFESLIIHIYQSLLIIFLGSEAHSSRKEVTGSCEVI